MVSAIRDHSNNTSHSKDGGGQQNAKYLLKSTNVNTIWKKAIFESKVRLLKRLSFTFCRWCLNTNNASQK